MLVCDRERDRPAPRADVDHPRRRQPRDRRERPLDDDLRLGARHERPRVRLQGEPPETPFAEDIGERLAAAAPLDERAECVSLRLGQRPLETGVELKPREAEGARDDQLGVEPRRVEAAAARGYPVVAATSSPKVAGGRPSSARRFASAASASVNSSRSPARTSASRPLTPTRWSVTRSCGSCRCPDLLGAIAPSDLRLARRRLHGLLTGTLSLVEAGAEDAHRLGPVLELGALVLHLDHEPGRQVGEADGGVGGVDRLATRGGGAVDVDLQVVLVELGVGLPASGITATVAVEVWIRPCDSVAGTRWTRWVPPSPLP